MRSLNSSRPIRIFLLVLGLAVSGHLPAFAVSGPPLRTGLWALQPIESGRDVRAFEARVRRNSYLSGVCLHIDFERHREETRPFRLQRNRQIRSGAPSHRHEI